MDWQSVQLERLSEVFTDGNWIESKDQSETGIRLVQTGNVGEGDFKDRRDKARWISEQTFERLNCFEVLPGDCLVSRLPDPVGRSCIVPATGDKMITAVDCSIIRPKPEALDAQFFVYFSQTSAYLQEVESRCTGTTRKRISRKNLGKVEIPLPPLEEQRRIVAVLDEAFTGLARARANAEANLADARELFPSMVAEVFRDSERWEPHTVAGIGQVFDGPHATPKTVDEGPLFLGISSLVDGRIELEKTRHVTDEDFKTWTRRVEPKAGDVVFSYETRLGQVGLIPEGMKCCLGRRMGLVRLNTEKVRPDFFVAYYLAPTFQELLRSKTVAGATVDRISIKDFPNFPVRVPPIAEQATIIERLAVFRTIHDKLVGSAEAKLADLDALRQSLLHQAFAGKLA